LPLNFGYYKLIFILLLSSIYSSCSNIDESNSIKLNSNWKFKSTDDTTYLKVKIPGSVHLGLLENNIIENPFYRLNEHNVQWVDKKDWEFKTTFDVDKSILNNEFVEIDFKGLDTYADVFLNNQLILKANNMFVNWVVECKSKLREGKNELRIIFYSPIKKGLEKREKLPYLLPGAENDQSELGGLGNKKVCVFTRKAQYHFGWDWGPRLVSIGIWKDIELKWWNKAKIEDLYIHQPKIEKNRAKAIAELRINSSSNQNAELILKTDNSISASKHLNLKKGNNVIKIPFEVENPELWWTNGLGNQKLYNIETELKIDNRILSKSETNIGLRTIELVRENDSLGKSFYFKVNNRPVFMKGANYIPQDIFLSRAKPSDYEHLIKSAAEANFNMLRVWGGGVYEKDIFYDLCDKYGILVWQDFMFACAMYPGNTEFLDNIKLEAEQNIKRLRNHACIALWCGDNEILSAWNRWGWKENVIENQGEAKADKIWNDYDTLFHKILPDIVKQLDPKTEYWSSSPSSDIGKLENKTSGDMHYWGVWWGKEPFSNYKTYIGRFMSEYGFQSFPEIGSIEKYTLPEDHDINSEVMKSHQRSSIGNVTIVEYMDRDYNKPKNFPMFIYVNHLLQAEGIKTAMEAHRRNMPYCMGSLYWQLNDCWPVASWSGIDYYGKWKALHYFTKKAFNNILVSPVIDSSNNLKIYGISDFKETKNAKLEIKIIDFEGNVKWEKLKDIIIEGNKSQKYFEDKLYNLIKESDKQNSLLYTQLVDDNGIILSENILYFDKIKKLLLPEANPEISYKKIKDGIEISISSDKLIKNIYFRLDNTEGHFSDNYFDIVPGVTKTIKFISTETIDINDFKSEIEILNLTDSY